MTQATHCRFPISSTHDGLTMDDHGVLCVVSENGGGDADQPQLWVYAPVPASVLLLGSALGGLGLVRKRARG